MYRVDYSPETGTLTVWITETLRKSDFMRLHPWLDQYLAVRPSRAIVVLLNDFEGWNQQNDFHHYQVREMAESEVVQRIAVVGDPKWKTLMAMITEPFKHAEHRYFDAARVKNAYSWVTLHSS
ncbi:MAG: STAS/SEC14 domain-containing protein [Pseudomonadota bacterium]